MYSLESKIIYLDRLLTLEESSHGSGEVGYKESLIGASHMSFSMTVGLKQYHTG